MTDEEPTGSCPTCWRRDPHEPLLCNPCRSKLRTWLGDIPALFAELQERIEMAAEPLDHRPYVATMVETVEGTKARVARSWRELTMRPADPVAYLLPAGAGSSPSATGPVSGSKEPRLPIDVDEVDLLAPPRPLMPERAFRSPDEDGHDSIASTLDFWVEDWREARGGREGRPAPYVPALAAWLLRRVDDAMDAHPAIVEFFDQVRQIHNALQGQLGLFDVPDYKRGIPCPRCSMLTLVHHNGSRYVECGSCPAVLSFAEFEEHVRTSWADHHARRKAAMAKAKALRALLSALHAAGWRHDVRRVVVEETVTVVHRWRRGPAIVEAWMPDVDGYSMLEGLWYVADEQDPRTALTVGSGWVEQNGYAGLQKLAKAGGLLTAPVREMEKAA